MHKDGEVLGIDSDDCLILWDANKKKRYNCGETLRSFGIHNLSGIEKARINPDSILKKETKRKKIMSSSAGTV